MKKAGIVILIFLIVLSCEVFKNETGKSVSTQSGTDIAVSNVTAPSSVTTGEIVTITVSIENVGDVDVDSEFNVLLVDQTDEFRIGTSTVEGGLAAGDTMEVAYDWDTGDVPAGEYTLQAIHEIQDENPSNDTTSISITVNEPLENDIGITQINAPSSAAPGEEIEIDITVENAGSGAVDEDITVTLENLTGNSTIASQTISGLQEGASTTLTYPWNADEASTGEHELQASHNYEDENSENNAATITIIFSEPEENDIAITQIDAPSSATQGDEVDIDVTVENRGNGSVDDDITVTLENLTENSTIASQTIGGLQEGASTTLTYSWNTEDASTGEHELQAIHDFNDDNEDNNSDFIEIDITEQQNDEEQEQEEEENEQGENDIAISGINTPSSAELGEQIDLEVTVENRGDQNVDEDISVSLEDQTDDNTIDTRSISGLGTGESETLVFTWETGEVSVGDHDLQASHVLDDDNNANNAVSATITINEAVEISGINPNRMETDDSIEVTISGSGFKSGVSVSFENGRGPDPEVSGITVPDANTITATVETKKGGPPDDRIWDVIVVNPDNSSALLENAFTVTGDDDDDDDDEEEEDEDDDDDNDDDDDD